MFKRHEKGVNMWGNLYSVYCVSHNDISYISSPSKSIHSKFIFIDLSEFCLIDASQNQVVHIWNVWVTPKTSLKASMIYWCAVINLDAERCAPSCRGDCGSSPLWLRAHGQNCNTVSWKHRLHLLRDSAYSLYSSYDPSIIFGTVLNETHIQTDNVVRDIVVYCNILYM